MVIHLLLFIGAYLFMEFVAWSNHKYVMHGFLWRWHKDHHINDQAKVALHENQHKGFEKNDLFFLVYALPAIALMIAGFSLKIYELVSVSIGITAYGFTYFMVHDVIIHQRLPLSFLWEKPGAYTKAIVRAHLAHHRPKSAADFRNFGLLIFSGKYFKE